MKNLESLATVTHTHTHKHFIKTSDKIRVTEEIFGFEKNDSLILNNMYILKMEML